MENEFRAETSLTTRDPYMSDFHIFGSLKKSLNGDRFQQDAEVKHLSTIGSPAEYEIPRQRI
jgi:hypothetical protein